MSVIQDLDLGNLDRLLHGFSERSQALDLDAQLLLVLQALRAEQLDLLPRPGHGQTLKRWQILACIASHDLSLAKLCEGHTDALAILAECDAPSDIGDGAWGVWAAESPTPFCRSSHFARLSADLPVYLRQSHAERHLATLGQQLVQAPAGAWQL